MMLRDLDDDPFDGLSALNDDPFDGLSALKHDPNEELELGPNLNWRPIPPMPVKAKAAAPRVAKNAPPVSLRTARDLQERTFPRSGGLCRAFCRKD